MLYDFFQVPGGAERVTAVLAQGLGNADVCVGSRSPAFDDVVNLGGLNVIDLGAGGKTAPARALKALHAFRRRTGFLSNYDWVLYSGSYAPVAVHNHPRQRNFYYCHTIPRFIYDLKEYYLAAAPPWQRPALRALAAYVRPRYEAAIAKMDLIVANSDNVRQRIRRYLGKDARVIHPPCDIDAYAWQGQGNYYLSTSRLEPYKRVDVIVEAFLRMPDKRLVVTSGGSDFERLRKLADGATNIEFTGWVDESELRTLVGSAIATIYLPRDEDFGMSPVESMAAGKPVIGVAEGGLLETVIDGKTGLLTRPRVIAEDVIAAVKAMGPQEALEMRQACRSRAQSFSRQRFVEAIRELVDGGKAAP